MRRRRENLPGFASILPRSVKLLARIARARGTPIESGRGRAMANASAKRNQYHIDYGDNPRPSASAWPTARTAELGSHCSMPRRLSWFCRSSVPTRHRPTHPVCRRTVPGSPRACRWCTSTPMTPAFAALYAAEPPLPQSTRNRSVKYKRVERRAVTGGCIVQGPEPADLAFHSCWTCSGVVPRNI